MTLADPYAAGGEVLMGTLRWEREQIEKASLLELEQAEEQARTALLGEEAELSVRVGELQRELKAKRTLLTALDRQSTARHGAADVARSSRMKKRGADRVRAARLAVAK